MQLNFQFCNLHFRLKKAYKESHSFKYPMFVWDLLPHAGASQIHPHIHGFLDTDRYQGGYIIILLFYMTCIYYVTIVVAGMICYFLQLFK